MTFQKTVSIAAVLLAACAPFAQAQSQAPKAAKPGTCDEMMKGKDMKGMDMKGMDMPKECADMMKGQDMKKGMDMKGMDMKKEPTSGKAKTGEGSYKATGVVKKVDATSGKVTLQHGPIESIGWPAMTMAFAVKDKKSLANLKPDQKVDFELVKQGSDYVITSIK
jgi:Cu(I)/Ag(I) efflux system protein CusF